MSHLRIAPWLTGLAMVLAVSSAAAQKPDTPPGQAKRPAAAATESPAAASAAVSATVSAAFFGEAKQQAYRDYLRQSAKAGRCPPGLAKKNNGCLPPGIAKRWAMGQPLPKGIDLARLPEDLRRRLGLPPPGYEYGRVDDDVVLIEIATRKVVEAILGRP